MPELPEVRVVRQELNKYVKNKIITDVHVFRDSFIKEIKPEEFKKAIVGETIIEITNYGKFLVFHLTNGKIILSHLRMEGKYNFFDPAKTRFYHDYVIFELDGNTNLHYNDTRMFGTFHLRNVNNYLTIEPLSKLAKIPAETDLNTFYDKLSKSKKAIKTLLLDQTFVVGLGNIYVDEVLFATKIHPQTLANKINKKQAKMLLETATDILDRSTELGGSSINSYTSLNKKKGSFQNFLQVHTKVNQPCPRCKNKIIKIKVNGRGTYYCPVCQREQ
ncbi:DNA-formamidopyrimidine glycosylase [Mesomycoplasma lagogenitalium]|uniref:Formamidopyrimidine-DNA glycosylase n=1 Tax=Mesomycoplasma lagogenitalium TaxID=171286 RepID=A0ABY8LT42_9BACT|nr:DNA-formamidopyrimidine glycosylase [Mesomycoplasma lagogenitalium]WGI36419.1 DNA-formamidopyrimidine glycosylase [Mesomycoplasma lagogenitalium]